MLGHLASYTSQLAAERQNRFAAEASDSRLRRLLRQAHPDPRCADLAFQMPDVVVDLEPMGATEVEPAAPR